MLDRKALYAAVKNNDPRLDGKFFVGVKSTAINLWNWESGKEKRP